MFYIEKYHKIVLFDTDMKRLENTLLFTPQYQGLEIKETREGYTIVDYQIITTEEADLIELNNAKKIKIQENDTVRDEAINSGVLYKDVLFDSDTDQKVNLLAIVSTMGDEDVITWFGMDNQPLECTKEDLINIGGLITALHSFCWGKNAEIKAEINEAETIEEVEVIEIDYSIENTEESSEK